MKRQVLKPSEQGQTPARTRTVGVIKLLRNTGVLAFSWYATGFSSLAVVVFGWYVYLTWGYIPVIVTGKPFEKTSERARGTTILIGLSLFFSLVIFIFVWLRQSSAT